MRVLFLTLYPKLQPSTRFRVVQFLPFLDKRVDYVLKSPVPNKIFENFYTNKSTLGRLIFHCLEFFIRTKDILLSFRYDVVFLQKGITTLNIRFLYRLLFILNRNVIFDFDDAITISQISRLERFPLSILQEKNEWQKIVRLSQKVIVGNERLKSDISGLNKNIFVIPTPVDTEYFQINYDKFKNKDKVSILWSGNKSGHVYLKICADALICLDKKFSLGINILTDSPEEELQEIFSDVKINLIKWSIDAEKEAFSGADIGVMPLYDTLWDRRKCAFKALLYMACGIPVVSSPIGVVNDFVRDGENGFLAHSDKEWIEKLEALIKDAELRRKMGINGRKTAVEEFSLSRWTPYWKKVVMEKQSSAE